MEQIIEIFADAISAFILKSISLQEENAIPGPELRKNADVVVETSHTLIAITREVAATDYKDFVDIQQPILECARNVEKAVHLLKETMDILYKDTDRARGWRKLVDATKTIGEQTSRLLVVIYGAEEKRLRRAGEAAKAALRKVRKHALLTPDELRPKLKTMADDTGDASSKVVQFNTFVGGRFTAETDPDLKGKLRRAFDDINRENQTLVNDANGVITDPASQPPRGKFVGTTDKLIDLIDEVLGNVKRPEDLDAYRIIEDLFNSGNKATLTEARPYDQIRDKGPYSKRDITEAGKKVIEAMEKVKTHPNNSVEDVINDGSIGSARLATFSEMTTVFAYQPENDALKPTLLNSCDKLNRENANLVGDCNDYLKTQKAGPSMGLDAGLEGELAGVKNAIKNTVQGAGDFARAPGTSNFVPSAKEMTEAVKDLLQGVGRMVEKVNDPNKTRELSDQANKAKQAVSDLVNAGKAANANPNDDRAKEQLKSTVGQLKASIQGLLGEANAVNQRAATAGPQRGNTGAGAQESAVLNNTAQKVIDEVNSILNSINPSIGHIRNRDPPTKMRAEDIDRNLLQRLADDALRMLEQLKGYPRYTPKETVQALQYAVEAVDLFNDRLGTKADAMRLAKLKAVLQQAVKNIKKGNDDLVNSCEKYLADPNARNDKELLGDINSLQNEIRAAMKELNPGDVGANRSNGNYYANVDPKDIKELGEAIKRSDDKIRRQVEDAPPKELAAESNDNINRADKFTDMVDSLAQDSRNPAFKNKLNDLTAKLRPAIDRLGASTNDYLFDPDSKRRGDDLKDSTKELDKLVDEVLAAIMPKAEKPVGKSPGNLTPEELQRMADEVKRAAQKVEDKYRTNAPQETVSDAQDTAQKAANFGAAVKERAANSKNPELKRELEQAVAALDKARDDVIDRTNAHVAEPNSQQRGRDLENATKDTKQKVDEIMDKIRPQAKDIERQRYTGAVTPKDIEREAKIGQEKLRRDDKFEDKKPKDIVRDAEDTGNQLEKVSAMLEKMADDQDRPAQRKKIQDLSDKLRDKNDDLIKKTNALIDNPDSAANRKALHDKNAEVDKFLDEVIREVKPKVQQAQGDFRGDHVTPKTLEDAANEVRKAVRKVKADHDKEPADALAKDTGDASKKVDVFKQMVDKRAGIDQRPRVAAKLKEAVPRLDSGNKRMVDGSNDYIADPNKKTSGEVHEGTQALLDLVDEIMDGLYPKAKLTTAEDLAGKNFGGLTNDQLRLSYEAVRAAVVKTKQFPQHMPKETAENSTDASYKVAVFAEQLRARSKEDPVRKMAEKLLKACNDLHDGNRDLVRSTNNYLGDPDQDSNRQELDGSCQYLLDVLDGIWREIDAQAKRQAAREGARRNVNPSTLADMAEKLKAKVGEVEGHRDLTPKELVAKSEEESGLASTFAEMVDEYGNIVPALKSYLADASKRVNKADDRILADTNALNNDRKDANKGRSLDGSCKAMKDLVDEIMARIRPKVNMSEPGRQNLGAVSNKDIAEAARALIRAADKTDKFRDNSPTDTADNASGTSQKAVDLYDKVKKVADSTPNRELARALASAERELPSANKEMVHSAEDYLGNPTDGKAQGELHSSLDNLKRIANDVLKEVAPELSDADLDNRPINCSMDELREAYNKAKASLDKQQKFETTLPSVTADRTKESAEDTNRFKNMAAGRAKNLGGDKAREAEQLIDKLNKDNRDLVPNTRKYFEDPSNPRNVSGLKNTGATVDSDLDAVFNAVRPRAVFTKADFNQPAREVSEQEIDDAAGLTKRSIEPVAGFAQQNDEPNAENTSEASRRMAKFTELVYLKASDKHMPAVSGTKLREVSRDLVDKNKNLVTAMNSYLDDPADQARSDKLRNAVRDANNAVDKGVAAVKDASSSLKSFEDQIEAASRSIRNAASEWDADDDIVAAALRIAEEMRKLAQAAREMNRKEIILRARNIAQLVKSDIIEYAQKRRDACGDAGTRNELSTGTTALSSFSTQLKIIASVKAADLGVSKDKTAENQLVACCQGISTSMRQTLKAAQSAKLLTKK